VNTALDRCTALAGNSQVRAFLRVIREGETNQTDDAYRMIYGGALIVGSDHPWYGRTTTDVGHSTAYGAYQFLGTSWKEASDALGLGNDTSPINQDLCAVWTMDAKRHALQAVIDGDLAKACAELRDEWISLPALFASGRAARVFHEYGGTSQDRAGTTISTPDVLLPSDRDKIAPRGVLERFPQSPENHMGAMFIPAILQLIPSLIGLFGGKGERAQQNAGAAQIVVDAFTKAVPGAVNVQQALEMAQANPAVAATAKAAVMSDPAVLGLVEVGGGVVAARTANLALVQSATHWWQLVLNPVFLVTMLTLPLVYLFVWKLIAFLDKVSSDVISQTMGTIIGLVLGSIMGFWMGQTWQQTNKRQGDPPA
jgi:muramidase (phage lysozyme)